MVLNLLFYLTNQITDKNSCILIIKIIIDDEIYILANTYNPNIEMEQLPTLSQYSRFLENSMISITKIILGGKFDDYRDASRKTDIRKTVIIKILDNFDLCDVY